MPRVATSRVKDARKQDEECSCIAWVTQENLVRVRKCLEMLDEDEKTRMHTNSSGETSLSETLRYVGELRHTSAKEARLPYEFEVYTFCRCKDDLHWVPLVEAESVIEPETEDAYGLSVSTLSDIVTSLPRKSKTMFHTIYKEVTSRGTSHKQALAFALASILDASPEDVLSAFEEEACLSHETDSLRQLLVDKVEDAKGKAGRRSIGIERRKLFLKVPENEQQSERRGADLL